MPGKSKDRLVYYSDFIGLKRRIIMSSANKVTLNLDIQKILNSIQTILSNSKQLYLP